mgnify:CR=1 FL=1
MHNATGKDCTACMHEREERLANMPTVHTIFDASLAMHFIVNGKEV